MPVTTPEIKIEAVRRLGGQVKLVGETYSETQTYAQVHALHLAHSMLPCIWRSVGPGECMYFPAIQEVRVTCKMPCHLQHAHDFRVIGSA